jgi:DNA repair exonuclease SbcCD nuclease subunit
MSKILILGDLHFGHKNGDKETAEYQMRVFDDFIFPLIDKLGITTVIQTGDFFDSRKAIRHDTMELVRNRLIPKTRGQEWHCLVGNHDMHLRESIYPNSCEELLTRYTNFTVYNQPGVLEIDGTKIDMIPWICRDNRRDIQKFINESTSSICVGHFELSGFQYYRGMASQGEDSDFLANYNRVWSGHFHTMSKNKHIQYVGTPYQLTFGDADDERGVWVYDTDTGKFEFFDNGMPRFSRIYYDHSTFDAKKLERYDGMLLKIIVKDRGDTKKFDALVDKLAGIASSVTVQDTPDVSGGQSSVQLDNLLSTGDIVDSYIDGLEETDDDKKKIKRIMVELLSEAMKS